MISHKSCRGVLDIKNGVGGVHGSLVLGRLANEALLGGEGHKRRRGVASLLVGDWFIVGQIRDSIDPCGMRARRPTDFDLVSGIVGNAGVGSSEINANGTVIHFVRHVGWLFRRLDIQRWSRPLRTNGFKKI